MQGHSPLRKQTVTQRCAAWYFNSSTGFARCILKSNTSMVQPYVPEYRQWRSLLCRTDKGAA